MRDCQVLERGAECLYCNTKTARETLGLHHGRRNDVDPDEEDEDGMDICTPVMVSSCCKWF
jgi:hypothetical protein